MKAIFIITLIPSLIFSILVLIITVPLMLIGKAATNILTATTNWLDYLANNVGIKQ